jgi:hypothetical protein
MAGGNKKASSGLKFIIVTRSNVLLLSANGRCRLTNSNCPGFPQTTVATDHKGALGCSNLCLERSVFNRTHVSPARWARTRHLPMCQGWAIPFGLGQNHQLGLAATTHTVNSARVKCSCVILVATGVLCLHGYRLASAADDGIIWSERRIRAE